MRRLRGYVVGGMCVGVVLVGVAYLYENRTAFLQYHLLKVKLMGDVASSQILASSSSADGTYARLTRRYRPSPAKRTPKDTSGNR